MLTAVYDWTFPLQLVLSLTGKRLLCGTVGVLGFLALGAAISMYLNTRYTHSRPDMCPCDLSWVRFYRLFVMILFIRRPCFLFRDFKISFGLEYLETLLRKCTSKLPWYILAPFLIHRLWCAFRLKRINSGILCRNSCRTSSFTGRLPFDT